MADTEAAFPNYETIAAGMLAERKLLADAEHWMEFDRLVLLNWWSGANAHFTHAAEPPSAEWKSLA